MLYLRLCKCVTPRISGLYRFKSGPRIRLTSIVHFKRIGLYIHVFVSKHNFFPFSEKDGTQVIPSVINWRIQCTINNWTNFVQIFKSISSMKQTKNLGQTFSGPSKIKEFNFLIAKKRPPILLSCMRRKMLQAKHYDL